MKKREINYTDEAVGHIKLINDFLLPPEQLVLKEETVKVTLALTKDSVNFFKKIAKAQHTHSGLTQNSEVEADLVFNEGFR